jgi:hypothetical protein
MDPASRQKFMGIHSAPFKAFAKWEMN